MDDTNFVVAALHDDQEIQRNTQADSCGLVPMSMEQTSGEHAAAQKWCVPWPEKHVQRGLGNWPLAVSQAAKASQKKTLSQTGSPTQATSSFQAGLPHPGGCSCPSRRASPVRSCHWAHPLFAKSPTGCFSVKGSGPVSHTQPWGSECFFLISVASSTTLLPRVLDARSLSRIL